MTLFVANRTIVIITTVKYFKHIIIIPLDTITRFIKISCQNLIIRVLILTEEK